MEKKAIRQDICNKRRGMSENMHMAFSESILNRLTALKEYQNAKVIYCYIDVNHEVGTRNIIEHSLKIGKEVAVPRVEGNVMKFFRIHSLEETAEGNFGIPEPVHNKIPSTPDIILVPGVAFSFRMERMGYGGGYYDKFLSAGKVLKIGLAYEFQMHEQIPVEKHDISMDIIVTEKQIYR